MSAKTKNVPLIGTDQSAPDEESLATPAQPRMGEGLGVFRGLILTALIYLAVGFLIWFVWQAFHHHGH